MKPMRRWDHHFRLGSARAVNRRYISDCVPLKLRLKASAGFVSASALGMACGPALACLFQTNFKIYKLTFNQDTLPGWVMALSWLVYLLWLWVSFREPPRENNKLSPQESYTGLSTKLNFLFIAYFYDLVHPLIFVPGVYPICFIATWGHCHLFFSFIDLHFDLPSVYLLYSVKQSFLR